MGHPGCSAERASIPGLQMRGTRGTRQILRWAGFVLSQVSKARPGAPSFVVDRSQGWNNVLIIYRHSG
jgi:hypothetical protein